MGRDDGAQIAASGLGYFPPSTPPAGESAAGSFLSGALEFARAVREDLGEFAGAVGEVVRAAVEVGLETGEPVEGVQGDS